MRRWPEKDADVSGHAGEEECMDAKLLQQDFEAGGEEARVHWLQDVEIARGIWP
jgi:hypothetical protein